MCIRIAVAEGLKVVAAVVAAEDRDCLGIAVADEDLGVAAADEDLGLVAAEEGFGLGGVEGLGCLLVVVVCIVIGDGVTAGGYLKPLSKLIRANTHSLLLPLRVFCNVQYLHIIDFKVRNILHKEKLNSYYKGFPVFGNLIELALLWCISGINDWDVVVKILPNCPKLQTFVIAKGRDVTTKDDWKYPYHVPECVSSHLTSCEILGYEAFEADFRFATYILQNARLLQVMTIRQTFCPKPFESSQYLEDLSSCQRISPACKLYVYNSKCQRIYPLI
ncbi:unnamed protein product [Trifolium pratense]|uniref:Uncharacterized protein n=1 Tax=Trifolium pratense TaxID=57577 RepID=A0ACB0L2E4_TRIPR|nr:unnamed protein product [Trifolium pratense]